MTERDIDSEVCPSLPEAAPDERHRGGGVICNEIRASFWCWLESDSLRKYLSRDEWVTVSLLCSR